MAWAQQRAATPPKGIVGMAFLKGIRISTFLFSGVLVYFAVHFFVGQQGVLSWHSYVQRADSLMAERDLFGETAGRARAQIGALSGGSS